MIDILKNLSNDDAGTYYRLTEDAYFHLDPVTTPFMNLGIWPAKNILVAQHDLVREVLAFAESSSAFRLGSKFTLLEIGPGWGGGQQVIRERWPDVVYHGLNCSKRQIEYAQIITEGSQNTHFHLGFAEDLESWPKVRIDMAIGIESVLHVTDKKLLYSRLRAHGVNQITLAEILVEDQAVVNSNPLFRPSLRNTASLDQYKSDFIAAGFHDVSHVDISTRVFPGWAEALAAVDPGKFKGNSRILRQFCSSYSKIAELAESGKIKYVLINGGVNP